MKFQGERVPATVEHERVFGQTYTVCMAPVLVAIPTVYILWLIETQPGRKIGREFLPLTLAIMVLSVFGSLIISKTVLTISDYSVRRASFVGSEEILWSQIKETRYLVRPVSYWKHFGLIGALISSLTRPSRMVLKLTLLSVDGRSLEVSSHFQNAREAVGIILNRIIPPMVSSVCSRIQRGETVCFGELELSASMLRWKKREPIPLGDITIAEIGGANFRIKRTDKWGRALSVRSDKIPDVLVLLEVLDKFAPRLKSSKGNLLAIAGL